MKVTLNVSAIASVHKNTQGLFRLTTNNDSLARNSAKHMLILLASPGYDCHLYEFPKPELSQVVVLKPTPILISTYVYA